VFIDLFVGQIDGGAIGDDERELYFLGPRTLALEEHGLDTGKDEFANRAAIGSRLSLQSAVERGGNINGCANGILLHRCHFDMYAINMEVLGGEAQIPGDRDGAIANSQSPFARCISPPAPNPRSFKGLH